MRRPATIFALAGLLLVSVVRADEPTFTEEERLAFESAMEERLGAMNALFESRSAVPEALDARPGAAKPKPEKQRTEFVIVGVAVDVVLLSNGAAVLMAAPPLAGSRTTYPYTVLCPSSSPAFLRCVGAREGAKYKTTGFMIPALDENGEPVAPYLEQILGAMGFVAVR